ncbi:hypothetical protein VNO77_15362 [Canavalia gladiata]|uniref:Uncharacterized protein n=1 Tax=Canavalia gladiata TaxID=3824 RepID=A0AAN9LZJ6_CANGL
MFAIYFLIGHCCCWLSFVFLVTITYSKEYFLWICPLHAYGICGDDERKDLEPIGQIKETITYDFEKKDKSKRYVTKKEVLPQLRVNGGF